MINTKDLRIGNYVTEKKHGFNNDTNPFQIFSIYHEDNNSKINGLSINNFEPIKLTQEWLLKFGGNNEGGKWDFPKLRGSLTKFCPIMDSDEYCYQHSVFNLTMKNIYFVHELQNLYFAITGDELVKNGI